MKLSKNGFFNTSHLKYFKIKVYFFLFSLKFIKEELI